MDFIERLFGVAPDGGNGLLELMLWLVPVFIGSLAWMSGRPSQRPHGPE